MKTTMTKPKRWYLGYLVFAWAGRQVYNFRLKLEEFNDWLDLKAGEFLAED